MKTLLSADLEDPDERLRIELVLRALELRDQLKTQLGG
jgi:DNA-binding PucR family transcriptional regulator